MAPWTGRTALVAGGAGFVGSALTRALVTAGARVHVVDGLVAGTGGRMANLADVADRIHFQHLDLTTPGAGSQIHGAVARADVVFNLMGRNAHQESMSLPLEDLSANVGAHLALLDVCRRVPRPPQIVLASTRQLYGRAERLPVDETHPVRPTDVNGVNRLAAEQHHQLYSRVYDLPVSVLRLTNCYGPRMALGEPSHGFIAVWLGRLLEGAPIEVWGGEQRRDLVFVDDVVDAMLHVARIGRSHRGEVFNVGSDDVVTLAELARRVSALMDGHHVVLPLPEQQRSIDIGSYYTDFAKLHDTGWCPRVRLDDGLRLTLEHYLRLRVATS